MQACRAQQERLKANDLLDALVEGMGPNLISRTQDGCIRKGLVRKLVLGCLQWAVAEADWSNMSLRALQAWSPDEGGFLDNLPTNTNAAGLSRAIFARDDWGPFVSLFCCLLHTPAQHEDCHAIAASPVFGDLVRQLCSAAGHAVSPHTVFADGRAQGFPTRRGKSGP